MDEIAPLVAVMTLILTTGAVLVLRPVVGNPRLRPIVQGTE